MAKIGRLIDHLAIIIGVLFLIEGGYSFVAGAMIPFWEFAAQTVLAFALIRIGIGRMNED